MIRPDCATRKAGAPSLGLQRTYSTFAGAWGTRLRVTRLVRPVLPPLRDEQV